jgi:hypothetical protein
MNLASLLPLAFLGTVVLTTIMAVFQNLRLSRMSIPFMLGAMVTMNRSRVMSMGVAMHLVNGFLFSLPYAMIFEALDSSAWWLGGLLGLAHALFVLTVVLPVLPAVHPRMVGFAGRTLAPRLLEPPGFMALHYGPRTPLVATVAHVAYGMLLSLYPLS